MSNKKIDISKEVSDEFYGKFSKGQVLGFQKKGHITHYKIVRLDKHRKIVIVEPIKLYTDDELTNKLQKESK